VALGVVMARTAPLDAEDVRGRQHAGALAVPVGDRLIDHLVLRDRAGVGSGVAPCLERIFAHAVRSDDPWHDLLAATGRTPESRGRAWRWDSTARDVL